MFKQKVHAPVQVLYLDGLFNVQMDILASPFFHRQLGGGCQSPVGHHGKEGISNRGGEISALEGLGKTTLNADAFPQPFKQKGSPGRPAGDELEACALSLQLLSIFRTDKTAEAGDKALEGAATSSWSRRPKE
jgi:hypothetical protein